MFAVCFVANSQSSHSSSSALLPCTAAWNVCLSSQNIVVSQPGLERKKLKQKRLHSWILKGTLLWWAYKPSPLCRLSAGIHIIHFQIATVTFRLWFLWNIWLWQYGQRGCIAELGIPCMIDMPAFFLGIEFNYGYTTRTFAIPQPVKCLNNFDNLDRHCLAVTMIQWMLQNENGLNEEDFWNTNGCWTRASNHCHSWIRHVTEKSRTCTFKSFKGQSIKFPSWGPCALQLHYGILERWILLTWLENWKFVYKWVIGNLGAMLNGPDGGLLRYRCCFRILKRQRL